jgi:glucuronate isomerase
MLDADRLFPSDPGTRQIARSLYEHTRALPILSPHGHCNPEVLAENSPITDPATELITTDHYLLRLLYSQGATLESLGVRPLDGSPAQEDGRLVWRALAEGYHHFRGTPSKLWLDYTLEEVFGVTEPLRPETSDQMYDDVVGRLAGDDFRPRSLFERFGIDFLATTEGALDQLDAHARLRRSGWDGHVVPTFRPDDVIDPDRPDFRDNLDTLVTLTGCDAMTWDGYLDALRSRRASFIDAGATASDHGHPSPFTADLSRRDAEALFGRVAHGVPCPGDAEMFRGQMLLEMAAMSVEDGLVLQLHTGSWRNHNAALAALFGPDIGGDIPKSTDYVGSLKPLLDRFGNNRQLTLVVYTLDETTYSRELAPLAGHYPALRLGPPWWFNDSPEGIRRFYRSVIETAGFSNLVGFNDDARSLLTIPARHDMSRRLNAGFLAGLVAEHRLEEEDAVDLAEDLACTLARRTFLGAPR